MGTVRVKTTLTKQEASKLAQALEFLEREDLETCGFLRESTKGLCNKFKPMLKEVGYGNDS